MIATDQTNLATPKPLASIDWLVMLLVGLMPLAFGYFDVLPELLWEHHPFHALIEGLGSFAAVIVAVAMIMLRQRDELPPAYIWLICGFVGMGILDGFHAATHAGHVFVWLHSTATFVGGVLFALVWLPVKINRKLDATTLALAIAFAVTAFAVASIALPDLLPAMKDDRGFTSTAKALNIGGGIGFLIAAAYIVFQLRKADNTLIFANLSVLLGVAGLIFEQSVLWDSNWWLWHLLRLAAYIVVLYFFLAVYGKTLLSLDRAHETLRSQIIEVSTHELQFRQSHEKLNAILDSTADAIISISTTGIVEIFNGKAEQLFGYSRDEVIGNNVSMLMGSPYQQEHDGYLRRYLDTGQAHIINKERELEARRKDGSYFPMALRVTEMKHGDRHLFIGVVQNITERQHIELERQQAEIERKQVEQERERIFTAIRDTVGQLSSASADITASMAQQSEGSETQSAAVAKTTSVVTKVADSAEAATKLASHVANTARRAENVGKSGRHAIEETRVAMATVEERAESISENMRKLEERAQAIAKIIMAMKDISDQTNLLALNASIEACHAGESGKGFAVVAAEVKALSQQAKQATTQVRGILSEIQAATANAVLSTQQGAESVFQAKEVVLKAEQTIVELSDMVAVAADVAGNIVSSAKQQADSITHVTKSMGDINRSAKESLATTQKVERAAQDLNALGNRLKQLFES